MHCPDPTRIKPDSIRPKDLSHCFLFCPILSHPLSLSLSLSFDPTLPCSVLFCSVPYLPLMRIRSRSRSVVNDVTVTVTVTTT